MGLGPQDYREGAKARLEDAQALFDKSQWVGSVYVAGRAAQAMLRSLIARRGSLEVGHDLRDHVKQVRALGMMRRDGDEQIEDAVNELVVVWRNDLRFSGERRFRQLLTQVGRHKRIGSRRIGGDPAKANARSLINAAEAVVSRGERIWKRSKRS